MKKSKKFIIGFILSIIIGLLTGGTIGFVGNLRYQREQANSKMKTLDKITMFFLVVKDVAKSKAFYVDQLGFKANKDYEQDGKRWVTIVPPGGGTEITITNDPEDIKQGGNIKMYLSTPDVKKAYQELMNKGITPTHDIKSELWGNWFSIEDPDSNRWLVVQWKY